MGSGLSLSCVPPDLQRLCTLLKYIERHVYPRNQGTLDKLKQNHKIATNGFSTHSPVVFDPSLERVNRPFNCIRLKFCILFWPLTFQCF